MKLCIVCRVPDKERTSRSPAGFPEGGSPSLPGVSRVLPRLNMAAAMNV